ncbi:ABC-type spermidine/putrescine transport system permease subunit II [Paraburkholderia sp. UCT70]|uniref:ABC transporter permease n=1 Tax=Paraburkholderia sp. UCT70 TaxID=2991068 RepID=UPI003D1CB0AD
MFPARSREDAVSTVSPPSLNPGYGEPASVPGASVWRRFPHVTLPLISPGIFAGGLFSALISLDNPGVSYFFGNANTTTLPVVMLSYLLAVEKIYGLRSMNG